MLLSPGKHTALGLCARPLFNPSGPALQEEVVMSVDTEQNSVNVHRPLYILFSGFKIKPQILTP